MTVFLMQHTLHFPLISFDTPSLHCVTIALLPQAHSEFSSFFLYPYVSARTVFTDVSAAVPCSMPTVAVLFTGLDLSNQDCI